VRAIYLDPQLDLPVPVHDNPLTFQRIILHGRIEEPRRDQGSVECDRLPLDMRIGPSSIVSLDKLRAVDAKASCSDPVLPESRMPRDLLLLFDSHTKTLYSPNEKRRSHDLLAAVTSTEV
jgi:hypothetical protein